MLSEVNCNLPDAIKQRGLVLYVVPADKLPEKYIDQLIKKSRQPHVLEFEGDEDARGRFKDRQAFYDWRKGKTRIFYLLLDTKKDNDLAAVLWFGEREEESVGPEHTLTFGIRFYEGYVGDGLAKPTMKICHKDAKRFFPDKKFWLSLHAHNDVAKHVYQTFGYKVIKTTDEKIYMVENFKAKKIVVIGGGHGTSVVLSALSANGNYDLAGVISMADDGGSTGLLRDQLGISAVGDIRQSLTTLSENSEHRDLLSYRFDSDNFGGHSFGNMLLAAGELVFDDIESSIGFISRALDIDQKIVPATLDKPYLVCKHEAGEIRGVYKIANSRIPTKNPEFYLEPRANINPRAIKLIESADLIIIAPGNFYCSIVQTMIVDGLVDSIKKSTAKTAMIANLVNVNEYFKGYSSSDYATELERIAGQKIIDIIITNNAEIDSSKLKSGESAVINDSSTRAEYKIIQADLVDRNKVEYDKNDKIAAVRSLVKHDKKAIAKIIARIFEEKNDR